MILAISYCRVLFAASLHFNLQRLKEISVTRLNAHILIRIYLCHSRSHLLIYKFSHYKIYMIWLSMITCMLVTYFAFALVAAVRMHPWMTAMFQASMWSLSSVSAKSAKLAAVQTGGKWDLMQHVHILPILPLCMASLRTIVYKRQPETLHRRFKFHSKDTLKAFDMEYIQYVLVPPLLPVISLPGQDLQTEAPNHEERSSSRAASNS